MFPSKLREFAKSSNRIRFPLGSVSPLEERDDIPCITVSHNKRAEICHRPPIRRLLRKFAFTRRVIDSRMDFAFMIELAN